MKKIIAQIANLIVGWSCIGTNSKSTMAQLLMMFMILVNGGLSLSEEQIASITQILMSALTPQGALLPMAAPGPATTPADTVRGMLELAQFLGVSVPTASG